MKISKEQVAKNREAILEAASRLFRERGLEHVTVAEVMQAAGLTHGAFYGHFKSKDDLVAQAIGHALTPTPRLARLDTMARYVDAYLTNAHRDDCAGGCPFAALGSETVRGPEAAREVMTQRLRQRIDSFAKTAPGRTAAERRRNAIGTWAAMLGAVLSARIVAGDAEFSEEILKETKAWLGV